MYESCHRNLHYRYSSLIRIWPYIGFILVILSSSSRSLYEIDAAKVLIKCYWDHNGTSTPKNTGASSQNTLPHQYARAVVTVKGTTLYSSNSIHIVDAGLPRRSTSSSNDLFDDDVLIYNKTTSSKLQADDTYGTASDIETVWTGILINNATNTVRTGYATLLQDSSGEFTGTFRTELAAYSLMKLPNTEHYQIKMTKWNDFPKNHDHPKNRGSGRTNFDRSYKNSSIVATKIQAEKIVTPKKRIIIGEDRLDKPIIERPKQDSITDRAGPAVVDILVGVTNRALCEFVGLAAGCPASRANTGKLLNQLKLTFVESNAAYALTGANVVLRLVKVIFIAPPYDGDVSTETLNLIAFGAQTKQWRQNAGADLVSFLTATDDTGYCGLAFIGSFESTVKADCLDGYAFAHEIGHNFGCLHDRATAGTEVHPYAHGWQWQGNGLPFRTIMAYECQTGPYCGTVPYFSGNGYAFADGRPLGNATNDNSRMIRENAVRISNFVKSIPNRPTSRPVPRKPTSKPVPGPRKVTIPTQIRPPTTCPDTLVCDPQFGLGYELLKEIKGSECKEYCTKSSDVKGFLSQGYQCGRC